MFQLHFGKLEMLFAALLLLQTKMLCCRTLPASQRIFVLKTQSLAHHSPPQDAEQRSLLLKERKNV